MGVINGYSAARMKQIEDSTITGGLISVDGRLLLTKRNGDEVDAGDIRVNARLQVEDSPSVDFTLSGAGTLASPWNLSAIVRSLPEGTVVTGVLEANYRGGPAFVKIGGAWSTEAYSWMTPYVPGGPRTVRLIKVGTTFQIVGQAPDGYYNVTLNSPWMTFAEYNGDFLYSNMVRARRLHSGIVTLTGFIQTAATATDQSVIGVLPEGCRPDFDAVFPIENNGTARALQIKPNGEIRVFGGSITSWITLDGIQFPAAGVADWTAVGDGGSSWGANFGSQASWNSQYGFPAFWKDPYGYVWMRGLVRVNVAASTDGTMVINLPAAHRAAQQHHLRTTGGGTYSGLASNPDNGIQWKNNSSSGVGDWISLNNIVFASVSAAPLNTYKTPRVFYNSWANVPNANTSVAYTHREDGLTILKGLMTGGSAGPRIFSVMPDESIPILGLVLLPVISSNARGRATIGSKKNTASDVNAPGAIVPTEGTSWFSLDSLMWAT